MSFSVVVTKLPKCDFCENDARYDAKTFIGPWANMCGTHWALYGPGKLGTGFGQMLITANEKDN